MGKKILTFFLESGGNGRAERNGKAGGGDCGTSGTGETSETGGTGGIFFGISWELRIVFL